MTRDSSLLFGTRAARMFAYGFLAVVLALYLVQAGLSGVTGIARTVGASLSPMIAGPLLGAPALSSVPFLLAGSLKIVYDLLLYRNLSRIKPPEDAQP